MNNALLPDILEINYRKNHYKHAQDVLNSIIWCSICNSDLKQNIINMNKKIMLHKKFLCLCCKNCFDKLSDSKNGCILCSLKSRVKKCSICNSTMCKRCTDSYFIKSKRFKKLKCCLGCSSSVLWSLRSQAAAILKCFSLELGTRLLVSGEESENKQKLREFIINSATCNENFTQEDIYQIRVSNLSNLVNSKIGPLLNGYQNLQEKNIEQCLTNFSELCEQILVNTCSVLSDSQCLFSEKIIESLNDKIKSILMNGILYKTIENDSNKLRKDSHRSDSLLTHAKNGLQKTCSVSLEKLDENIVNQYILKKECNESIIKHSNKSPSNSKNGLVEIQTNQHKNNLNLTCSTNNQSQMLVKDIKQCTVQLERLDEKTIKRHIGQKNKEMMDSKADNHHCDTNNTSKTFNLLTTEICRSPILKVKKNDVNINNPLDSKAVNNNFENSPKLNTVERIHENVHPKECIVLETLSMDTIKNVNHNKQKSKKTTVKRKKITGIIKKSPKKLNLSKQY